MAPGQPERWHTTRQRKQRKGNMSRSIPTKVIKTAHLPLRMLVILSMLLGMLGVFAPAQSALAAAVSEAVFSGRAGTYKNPAGTLYAKEGGELTLTVTTDSNVKCVVVSGAHSEKQGNHGASTSWSFSFTAPGTTVPDGVRTVQATAYQNQNCTAKKDEGLTIKSASYVLDNTGPTLKPSMTDKTGWSPAPNAAGWNKSDVTITWSASDGEHSGVKSGPTPASDSVTADTAGVTKSSSATDQLDNSGSGSVTVKLDKTPPTISGSRTPAANSNGWNNSDVVVSFACADPKAANGSDGSGIKSCTAAGTDPASASKTLSGNGANQSVSGTAVDNADNSASATVGDINIDKVAPTISASATLPGGAAYAAGTWTNQDVTVSFSCADALSGPDSCSGPVTLKNEGADQSASGTAKDKAGNSASATFGNIDIDKTAPSTTATAPANWNNVDVTVSLSASDALSGVKSTHYKLNGGAQQTGSSVSISAEGVHTLEYWSVDNAGNVEAAKSVTVKIDKTKPQINHTQNPAANSAGWNNSDVTVTFECTDGGSGTASCTAPQTVTTEGANQSVTGTAVDNAGNEATDPAKVSIDKTKPTITAARDRAANTAGWYDDDVTVSFACADALSGIKSCTAPQKLGEGADQSASGTATDAAGNSASATERGINVDKTAPLLSGAATTNPNGNGWYSGDVTVAWTCRDTLSGIAGDGSCPANQVLTGEGGNLSASASVSDKAGNSTSATVNGIKIDRTAPSTSASVPAPPQSGWYAGSVTVTLQGVDSLSGVATTYYSVDGGAQQVYSGTFSVSKQGVNTITFYSVDKAGNAEKTTPAHTITLKIDGAPPTIEGSRSPAANENGWNNSDVVVSFACNDAASGIASCAEPTPLSAEGQNQSVTGTAVDNVGYTASATVGGINIDKTAPTITASAKTADDKAYTADSWTNQDVTVSFTCGDALSGIATCPASVTLSGNGAGQEVAGTAEDKAGNTNSATVSGINIDKTAPKLTLPENPTVPATSSSGAAVSYTASASDDLDSAPVVACSPASGSTFPVGTTTVTCSATDRAGNTASGSFPVTVTDTTAPVISKLPANMAPTATSAAGAVANWTAPSATDNLDGPVPVTCASATGLTSGSTFPLGTTTVTCTATDKAGNTASGSFTVTVTYSWSGLLQPVNSDGSSIFKLGSTVPVKFKLTNGSAGITNATAKVYYAKVSNGVAGSELEGTSIAAADSGNTFRYDATNDQYIFNLGTKGLSEGTYQLRIDLGDGVLRTVNISLKK